MTAAKKDIRAYSSEELQEFFKVQGDKAFRGKQVYQWLWNKGIHQFDKMTNLSKETRAFLDEHFTINHIAVDQQQRSKDGTIKNAIQLFDGRVVESVLIPVKDRTTACVSSQVGCSLDCKFCATAKLDRMRNLKIDEIFDQVVAIDHQSKAYFNRPLSNIVFMGMGEPLMNYNNVLGAIEKITSPSGLGMSPKRITLSTSGLPKLIKKMADDGVQFNLAVSLHTAIQETREQIMPFAKNFPLLDLLDSLKYWHEKTGKIVTYEYVVWEGINDNMAHIRALVDFCKQVPSKVNLIEYNAIGEDAFRQARPEIINQYMEFLSASHITATVRRSRGKDIDAACGQLANKNKQNT
ncbi:23S rRNA (adenine(2503)-C(2))-methyltransferase RlmN [Flavobacteriaceae bacterium]|nr:23S rRNA (adenine(2503)-C(2))-methyltransferase RlmN [Flavobacteriaceae bacterium]MDC1060906.1 23S rRNA (adenine(2503)-C(2))-methyltransferase RlmN [Flavobacteriaceae bacterium]